MLGRVLPHQVELAQLNSCPRVDGYCHPFVIYEQHFPWYHNTLNTTSTWGLRCVAIHKNEESKTGVFYFGFLSQNFHGSRTWIDDTRLFFNRQSPHAQLSRRSNQTNSLIHYFTIRSSGHQKSDFHFLFTYYVPIYICTYCYRNMVPLPTVT